MGPSRACTAKFWPLRHQIRGQNEAQSPSTASEASVQMPCRAKKIFTKCLTRRQDFYRNALAIRSDSYSLTDFDFARALEVNSVVEEALSA